MNWKRTKIILIFLFLLINIFLFNMLGSIEDGYMTIDESTLENTVMLANNAGIDISREIISDKRYKNGNMELFNVLSEPDLSAERFLGKGATLIKKSTQLSYYKYENKGKIFEIDNGRFSFVDTRESKKTEDDETAKQKAISGLEKFEIKPRNIKVTASGMKNGKRFISVKPCYKGYTIEGVSLDVFYDGGGITEVSGNWFDFSEFTQDNSLLNDITLVIAKLTLKDSKKIKIEKIELSYLVSPDLLLGRYVSAIPVYILNTSEGERIVIDARTGESVN